MSIIQVRVSSSSDDAEQSATGSVNLTSSDLELVNDGNLQTVGLRFPGITIPQGVTITNAYIQFKVDETSTEATNLTIHGEASDNASTFTTTKNNISSRSKTTASVAWSPPSWTSVGAASTNQRTNNIASVIQEIINRPGWKSGNALATIITGTGKRVAESYNGDAAGAPLLYIEYVDVAPKPTADLSLNTTVDNSNPTLDSNLIFTVAVTNAGPDSASGVTVTDLLPSGLSFSSVSPSQGSYDEKTGIWDVGTVNNGATVTLKITATATAIGSFINNAQVSTSTQFDPDSTPGNNNNTEDDQDSLTIKVVPQAQGADLALSKTVDIANPRVGDNITFTLKLDNFGPSDASNIKIQDLLPTGLSFVSATASQGTYDNLTGIWTVNNLSHTSSSETISFAAFGDYGKDNQPEADVANLVKTLNPDFIITTGDNSYDSTPIDDNVGKYYSNYIGDYRGNYGVGSTVNRFFPSLGSHEYTDGGGINAYLDYFNLPGTGIETSNTSGNERYYDFVQGPIHFFVINAQSLEPDGRTSTSIQAQWLKNRLAASTSTWKIVYMHEPPYSSGSTHGSTSALRWPYEDWGVTAVLTGHEHLYERIVRDDNQDNIDLPYFITGLGGADIYPFASTPVAGSEVRYNSDWGTMLVEANEQNINFEFHSLSQGVIDRYTIGKPNTAKLQIVAQVTSTGTFTNTAEVIASDQSDPDSTPGNHLASEDDQDSVEIVVGNSSLLEVRVQSSSDDAEQSASGKMNLTSSDLELVNDGSDQLVGMRFAGVNIPQAAKVTNAYIQFKVDETTSVATNLTIRGQDTDNAPTFTTTSNDITSRLATATDASVLWNPLPWTTVGTAGVEQQTPNLASVIQEIVNRPGWKSGNALATIISGTGERVAMSYDFAALSAPLLHVEFIPAM